jgi:hypothetical protein
MIKEVIFLIKYYQKNSQAYLEKLVLLGKNGLMQMEMQLHINLIKLMIEV